MRQEVQLPMASVTAPIMTLNIVQIQGKTFIPHKHDQEFFDTL